MMVLAFVTVAAPAMGQGSIDFQPYSAIRGPCIGVFLPFLRADCAAAFMGFP
jgi:hypothetical protein